MVTEKEKYFNNKEWFQENLLIDQNKDIFKVPESISHGENIV